MQTKTQESDHNERTSARERLHLSIGQTDRHRIFNSFLRTSTIQIFLADSYLPATSLFFSSLQKPTASAIVHHCHSKGCTPLIMTLDSKLRNSQKPRRLERSKVEIKLKTETPHSTPGGGQVVSRLKDHQQIKPRPYINAMECPLHPLALCTDSCRLCDLSRAGPGSTRTTRLPIWYSEDSVLLNPQKCLSVALS